jgi:tripartite-type tricarboxylate transporter receptor subunit TctC
MRSLFRPLSAALVAACLLPIAPARAEFPDRPIKIIIPYQAGGGTDIMTRVIIDKLRERIAQPILVDTKPGADTLIGTRALLAAPPDGYTLMMTTPVTFTTVPFTVKNLGYDPLDAFTLISYVAYTPVVFVVNSAVKAHSLSEFIALAKAEPGKYTLGTYGTSLSSESIQRSWGIRLNGVPYKGVEAVHAVASGQVDAMFDGVFTGLPQVKAGKTRPLAMIGNQRTRFAPDIPTANELGFKVPNIPIWYALVGPKGMDAQVAAKLEEEFRIALQSAQVRDKLATFNVETLGEGPAALRTQITTELELYRGFVKELGIVPQ